MATFDVNLNVTFRVNAPRMRGDGDADEIEEYFAANMDGQGRRATTAEQREFWRTFVKEHPSMFMYLVTDRRDIRNNEVTITLV